jgi:opacity protein-like surface antigen
MNKRLLLVLAALCSAPALTQAQIVIKGGLSYGNVTNSGLLPGSDGQRNGLAIGVGAKAGDLVGVGVEALYAQRGIASARLDYIDLPVYLRVALPSPVSPFAYLGPQASFELKCGSDSNNCAGSGRPKLTYAGVIGAGVKFAALNNISLEGRYVYGLTDLSFNTISSSSSYKTRSFMLLFGIGL